MLKLLNKNKVRPIIYDSVFKKIFSLPCNKKLISYLINKITKLKYSYIYNDFKYGNTELLKKNYSDKGKVTDLLIYLKNEIVNLEMNKYLSKGTIKKNNIYHHHLSGNNIKKGENYCQIKKVIQINFNAKGNKNKNIIEESKMRNKQGANCTDEYYITYHINMKIALKKYYNKCKLTRFEKILVMMQLEDKGELQKIAKGDEMLMIFEKTIEGTSEETLGVYDKEAAEEFVRQIDIEDAKVQGMKKGLTQKAKEIAINMLKANMQISEISKLTGLKPKEISKLANNL